MTDPSFKQKLQALVEASTKGPWKHDFVEVAPGVEEHFCGPVFLDDAYAGEWTENRVARERSPTNGADARLIVHLVNAAPAILELLEAARELRYACTRYDEQPDSSVANAAYSLACVRLDEALSALEASNG